MPKQYRTTVIHADGSPDTITIGKQPALDALQKAVGGYIQLVPGFNRFNDRIAKQVYCNEDGMSLNLPFNERASGLWTECVQKTGRFVREASQVLLGDVVIVQPEKEANEES